MSNPMKSWPRKSFNSTSTIHKVSNVLGGGQMLVLSFVKIIHAHTHTFTHTTRPHMHTWKGGKGWRIGFGCEQLLYGTNSSLKGVHVVCRWVSYENHWKAYMRTPTFNPSKPNPTPQKLKKESDSVSNSSEVCTAQHTSLKSYTCMHICTKPYYSLKP
jgi:hypothetical protein